MLLPCLLLLEDIEKEVPKHSYNLGASLLACGDVAGFSVSLDEKSNYVVYSCFVHSELTSMKWYLVKIHHRDDFFSDPICTCYAVYNERKCKHVACLLFTIHSLLYFQESTTPPKLFRRKKMKCFENASRTMKDEVDYDLTWQGVIARILNPPPKKRN